jgi:hypothetical protein
MIADRRRETRQPSAAIAPVLISLACGLVAAHDSSKVKIDPAWELEIRGDVGRNIMG